VKAALSAVDNKDPPVPAALSHTTVSRSIVHQLRVIWDNVTVGELVCDSSVLWNHSVTCQLSVVVPALPAVTFPQAVFPPLINRSFHFVVFASFVVEFIEL